MNVILSEKQHIQCYSLAAAFALVLAYIAEYGLGLLPCPLCLYQRIPYALIICIGVVSLYFYKPLRTYGLILCTLLFAGNAVLAFFHMGVEYGWFVFHSDCADTITATSTDALLQQLQQAPVVRCDEPALVFAGLSMAGWNMVYAGFCTVIGLIFHCKNNHNIKSTT